MPHGTGSVKASNARSSNKNRIKMESQRQKFKTMNHLKVASKATRHTTQPESLV